MADIQTCEVNAKLAPLNIEHEILYSDRPSEDEQLLVRPLLRESKNMNMAGS
jgi:hypothetical protein